MLTACSSPYERGLDLGREHAKLVREGELTAKKLARDLEEVGEQIREAADQEEFRRGYSEATEPVRRELDKLMVKETMRDLGRDFGKMMRDLKEGAEEFGKGAKEGFEEGAR
jgi:hypothetical protein